MSELKIEVMELESKSVSDKLSEPNIDMKEKQMNSNKNNLS